MENKISNIEIITTLNELTSIYKFGIDGNQVMVWQGKMFSQFIYLSNDYKNPKAPQYSQAQ